jgi:phage-related minor tail protein
MEDAFIKFAMTGKTSFKDLANAIIADIIRIQIRSNVSGPLAGMFSSMFSSSPTSGSVGDGTGAQYWDGNAASLSVPSADGGGFTGLGSRSGGIDGKGGFHAILHPNETVIDHTKGQKLGGSVQNNVSIQIMTDGSSKTNSDSRAAAQLGRQLEGAIMGVLVREKRNGGLLASA